MTERDFLCIRYSIKWYSVFYEFMAKNLINPSKYPLITYYYLNRVIDAFSIGNACMFTFYGMVMLININPFHCIHE